MISAVGQLNRPSLPDIAGRDSFAGPSFHSARWDHDVDLRGQAGRGDRHRRERGAVHPRDRAGRRRAARVPAHAAVARARRPTTTTRCRPGCAGCTATCRRTASGTASGSSGAWATARSTACASTTTWEPKGAVGQRDERLRAHDAHRVPRGRSSPTGPTCCEQVVPDVPAGREAHAARQRRLGRHAQARQRAARSPTPIREITPDGHRHRRRRGARRSTCSSTAPASRRRSSSRR